ncbi:MAG: eCIS core domain-containing protein [Pyrinomonadaceae bacterium]
MKLSRELNQQLEDFFREFFDDENLRLPEIEIYGKRGARIVTKIFGVQGITIGRFIFITPDLVFRDNLTRLCVSKELLAHEATHVLQYQQLGTLKFLYRYFKSFFVNLRRRRNWNFYSRMQAYLEIPFESEARAGGAKFAEWNTIKGKRKTENDSSRAVID